MTQVTTLPELLDVAEVAKYLGVSKSTVEREARRGALPFTRIGSRRRFTHDHIREYLEKQQGAPCPGKGPASSAASGSAGTDTARGAERGSTPPRGKLDALRSASRILTRQ